MGLGYTSNVGKAIIPSPKSPQIGGINHSQMGGLVLVYPHYTGYMFVKPNVRRPAAVSPTAAGGHSPLATRFSA